MSAPTPPGVGSELEALVQQLAQRDALNRLKTVRGHLDGIIRMVEAAQASASRAQALADRAAAILFYVALGSGIVTLAFWWIAATPAVFAVVAWVAVLGIAWDALYSLLQAFRWERDWPPACAVPKCWVPASVQTRASRSCRS